MPLNHFWEIKNMPVILTKPALENADSQFPAVAELLADKNGKPTLEAQVMEEFLSEVDFDDLFEHADIREFVELASALAKMEGDEYVVLSEEKDLIEKFKKGENPFKKKAKKDDEEDEEDDEEEVDDEEVEEIAIETLAGDILAEFVDMDDMVGMFANYIADMPTESLEQKARRAVWEKYFGEGSLAEFEKGDFRKIAKTPAGHSAVKGMMLAMLHKQAIKRNKAAPVSTGKASTAGGVSNGGYKNGGYVKGPGYAPGTKPGYAKVRKYKKGKGSKLAAQQKKTQTKVGKVLKAVAGGGDSKTAAAKVKSRKGTGKGKKSLVAHAEAPAANLNEAAPVQGSKLMEGARLSGTILKKMHGQSVLVEGMNKPGDQK